MEDITLREYFSLADKTEYESTLKYLKPVNSFAGGKINFNKLSYADVQKCLKLIKSGNTVQQLLDLYCVAYSVIPHNFWQTSVQEYFAAQNNLISQFFNMQQRESKLLKTEDSDTHFWQMAGGDKLNKFSALSPLAQLAEIYGMWPFDLQHKPYNEIMVLLVYNKEKAEINKEFNRLKAKHQKPGR